MPSHPLKYSMRFEKMNFDKNEGQPFALGWPKKMIFKMHEHLETS